MTTDFEISA